MKQTKKWVRFRHRVVRNLIAPWVSLWTRLACGCRPEQFQKKNDRPYLILFNHQTVYDQFFVGLSFQKPVYYVCTEDLLSMGFLSTLLRWLFAPVPFRKQTVDAVAVRNCRRIASEGGNVAIAPEGSLTCSGRTEYIRPSIASLVKALQMPVALYRIEGGYGTQPRWGRTIRRGKMQSGVYRVIEPEEYGQLTNEELYREICSGLDVRDCREDAGPFRSGKRAEYLERVAYYCPWCGFSVFHSKGGRIVCTKCSRGAEYGEDLRLRGVTNDFPYTWFAEWYDAQEAFVRSADPAEYPDAPVYTDEGALYRINRYRNKRRLRKNVSAALYGDRIVLDEGKESEQVFAFSEIASAVLQMRNRLNLCLGDGTVYQFRGGKRFNAVKYVHFFYRFRMTTGQNPAENYLGF